MWDHIWDFFVETLMVLSLPMLSSYYVLTGDLFLNVSAKEATGLEKIGNTLLIPLQYLAAGREAIQKEDGSWEFIQRFEYKTALFTKSTASILSLPMSLIAGSAVKGLAFLTPETRERHASMLQIKQSTDVHPHLSQYESFGMQIQGDLSSFAPPESYARRPGDENHLKEAKEALRAVGALLTEAKIPWWVDCGTLLGAYRYGGGIPWDSDVDLSILVSDFENARRALNQLDPTQYVVQDWSGRDCPNTFFKIYLRKTRDFLDIDTYAIDEKKREISCIFSLEGNLFFPEWFKIRERRFSAPIGFSEVFPLQKALFDGVEVFIPHNPKSFLQRYYGDNLAPAKIYDPHTGRFEKDPSHPYWQRAYVH